MGKYKIKLSNDDYFYLFAKDNKAARQHAEILIKKENREFFHTKYSPLKIKSVTLYDK
ncbi:MAG: hypothetical protein HC905_26145 [Bacteroidales bacterium]|nr:hypothetical protein [Bacteroidales bacterium]